MLIVRVVGRCHRTGCQSEAFDEAEARRALAGMTIDGGDLIDAELWLASNDAALDRQRTLKRAGDDGTVTDADQPAADIPLLSRRRDLEHGGGDAARLDRFIGKFRPLGRRLRAAD